MKLPSCGLYRTTAPIEAVPAGRLVYFHNHGDPGPGIYLPVRWRVNRASFSAEGITLPDPALATTLLEPLPSEGLYRVAERFTCCDKQCRTFQPEELLQLGYDGAGDPIVFTPEWTPSGLAFPELGQKIDRERMSRLVRLSVPESHEHAPAQAQLQ